MPDFVGVPASSARGDPGSVTGGRGRTCSSRASMSVNRTSARRRLVAAGRRWRAYKVKVM